MKILFAGDTHGNIGHVNYLIRTARDEGCDRIFILGDFGYWEHQKAGIHFLDVIGEYAIDVSARAEISPIQIYFLDGNHDKTSLLVDKYSERRDDENFMLVRPNIHYAWRGHRWTWDGLKFISLGGAYSVDKAWRLDMEKNYPKKYPPESVWFPEEEMSDEDMNAILENRELVNVILAHDKPRGSNPGWNRKDFPECLPNQDRLQRAVQRLDPEFFFHGHLHYWYTEDMWHSHDGITRDVHVTRVLGLDCDAGAASSANYTKSRSWIVLDTADLQVDQNYLKGGHRTW